MFFGKYWRSLFVILFNIGLSSSLATSLQAQNNPYHRVGNISLVTLLAQAGTDKTVTLPDTRVTLTGTVQGGTAKWTQLSGPMQAVFKSTGSAKTTIIVDKPGSYVLRLTSVSSTGESSSDDVTVTVNANPVVINNQSTPFDHLRAMNRPVFKKGHTLLPLTHANCGVGDDNALELANYWGYALHIGAGDVTYLKYGSDYGTSQNSWVKLIQANPKRYRLASGIGSLYAYFDNYDGRHAELPKLPQSTWLRDAAGNIILNGGKPIVSPAAPDETFQIIGNFIGPWLGALEKTAGQPIEILTNGGEYGLWLLADQGTKYLLQDPKVVADFNKSGLNDWYAYISRNKARQEGVLKQTMFSYLQTRPLYSWYQEQYGVERGRWSGWKSWMFLYEYFLNASGQPIVSDYAAPEMYYSFHNSGWSGVHSGSMVPLDALTQALNNISGAISLGQKFVYPWVSAGWEGWDGQPISDPDRFLGMMKEYYTAGAIGSASGYFVCSGPIWEALRYNKPVGTKTPTVINQVAMQGQAHALFSHLEEYLRNGDLLPGPNQHPYSGKADTKSLPAMEFPVEGETAQASGVFGPITIPTARVLARKIRNENRWLVTAWANVGEDRDIRVNIDNKLGTLTLRARKAGSVYVVTIVGGQPKLTLIDVDAMNPTSRLFP
ncbi:PKD domain-containing protein [aff. Roholtiella sp. LEGE 12411]|uniref:PKD domain-containing protein n=1 Tax=aff. Roholtiella sp. LEGE 12411 TaxID=1828822 RepID=UPI00403FD59B